MKIIEVTAKSKETAIMNGLTQLGVSIDRVKIEVISEGGLFSRCKIRMQLLEESFEDLLNETLKESKPSAPASPAPAAKPAVFEEKNEKTEQKPSTDFKSDKKFSKPEHAERAERADRPQRSDKPAFAKPERNDRNERHDRHDRNDRRATQDAPIAASTENKTEKAEKKINRGPCDFTLTVGFLADLLQKMGITAELTTEELEEKFIITINTEESGAIIGYRGETLDALQYVCSQIDENPKKVILDCQNYREKRSDILVNLAKRKAEQAVSTGRRIRLDPMNAYERRVIHSALADNTEITTHSEGVEPGRYIVISPKRYNNRDRGNNNNGNRNGGNRSGGYNRDRGGNDRNKSSRPQSAGSGFLENTTFNSGSGFEENNTFFNKK